MVIQNLRQQIEAVTREQMYQDGNVFWFLGEYIDF
jgi:hypothetical protein